MVKVPDLYGIDFQTLGHSDVSRSPAGCLGEKKSPKADFVYNNTKRWER